MSDPRLYMDVQTQQGSRDADMAELFTPTNDDPDAPRIYTRAEKLAWIVRNRWAIVVISALSIAVIAYRTGAFKM